MIRGDKAEINIMTLVHVCAVHHKEAFQKGIYAPSVAKFQMQIQVLKFLHRWDFTLIFDEAPPPEKSHEHRRRCGQEDSLSVTSIFVSICIYICQRMFVEFAITFAEADMQVGWICEGAIPLPLCRDSDEIGYENKK